MNTSKGWSVEYYRSGRAIFSKNTSSQIYTTHTYTPLAPEPKATQFGFFSPGLPVTYFRQHQHPTVSFSKLSVFKWLLKVHLIPLADSRRHHLLCIWPQGVKLFCFLLDPHHQPERLTHCVFYPTSGCVNILWCSTGTHSGHTCSLGVIPSDFVIMWEKHGCATLCALLCSPCTQRKWDTCTLGPTSSISLHFF